MVITTTDLSPFLETFVLTNGGVGITAFVASSTSVCAVGIGGNQTITIPGAPPSPPVDLWSSAWHGGSLTKSMTATLAALLVKDDSVPLQWDTTLGDVYPEAVDRPYENVTLAQLASHRGGFRRGVIEGPEDMNTLASLMPGESLLEQRRGVALYGFTLHPIVTPGQDFQYSDLGYTILGSMLEQRTGQSWEDMITERLFEPLGLKSAYFGCPDTPYDSMGHFFHQDLGMLVPMQPTDWCGCIANYTDSCYCDIIPAGGPAGNVYMQLGDYIRYYQWHLKGEIQATDSKNFMLLSTNEFKDLHSPLGGAIDIDNFTMVGYGNGWMKRQAEDLFGEEEVLWHTGSSQRMWVAEVYMSPQSDRAYFVASNTMFPTIGGMPLPLDLVFAQMISSDDGVCDGPAIDDLDGDREVGSHDKCPDEIIYGTSEVGTNDINSQGDGSSVDDAPKTNDTNDGSKNDDLLVDNEISDTRDKSVASLVDIKMWPAILLLFSLLEEMMVP